MDELIELVQQEKDFVLKDYFEFNTTEEEGGELLVSVYIKDKGQKILDKKKQADPNFNEESYFEKLIRDALTSYMQEHGGETEEEGSD